ncbi:hypothetical protein Tsubulata_022171 [Turnera subulata]|uniref:PHD-type domain-containing protein n=1 Tax=Turnera subulata TaxID=218843 RepID=A0A9Q0J2E4_9ROSI|nr:hypothetical protein Tsubulata_022171 [Turnera subulata]
MDHPSPEKQEEQQQRRTAQTAPFQCNPGRRVSRRQRVRAPTPSNTTKPHCVQMVATRQSAGKRKRDTLKPHCLDIVVAGQSAVEREQKRTKRFACDDKVEIRSLEEGFLGSWHPGTVIGCHRLSSGILYNVKYDNMLAEDESHPLVEQVFVEDIVCPNASKTDHRGIIRPIPPPFEFGEWNLPYGTCVDVYYRECWWEGVIADHNDGSEERKIFFPDLGDEMMASLDSIRISQDWNHVSEMWHHRGIWLLLQSVEEHEQRFHIPVSIQQLWYEIQERESSEKLGDWTSSDKSLWDELLMEAIAENIKVAAHDLFLEFIEPVNNPDLHCQADPLTSLVIVPDEILLHGDISHQNSPVVQSTQEKSSMEQLASLSPESNMNISVESSITCQDRAVYSVESYTSDDERVSELNLNNRNPCSTRQWLPAGPDIVPGAEFCPDAIANYAHSGSRKFIVRARKHLAFLKWKIEFIRDKMIRLRFTSPDGKCYYSLRRVCEDLYKNDAGMLSPFSHDEQRCAFTSPGDCPSHHTEQSPINLGSDCYARAEAVGTSSSDFLYVEPHYCPQAIEEWCNLGTVNSHGVIGTKRTMADLARKHLSALGWVFLRGSVISYRSPTGRSYNSLRQACKAAMRQNSSGGNSPTGRRMIVQGQLTSPTEFTEISFQRDENCRQGSSCMAELRTHLDIHIVHALPAQKPQSKRKGSLHMTPSLLQTEPNSDAPNSTLPILKSSMVSREMIEVRNNTKSTRPIHGLRSCKRVQQVVLSNPSNQNPKTILSRLIENDVVLPRTKVHYYARKNRCPIGEGQITRLGIKCKCCGSVFTLRCFERHVHSKVRRTSYYQTQDAKLPYTNIFLKDGRSLLDCLKQLIKNEKLRSYIAEVPQTLEGNPQQRENDSVCSLCHYGGELVLCDLCPSSFHIDCLGMKDIPEGDWFCPSCCCRICRQSQLTGDAEQITDGGFLSCTQCELKYHVRCLHDRGTDVPIFPKQNWFCCKKCEVIFSGLQELLGHPIPVGVDNLTWTLFKSKPSNNHELDEFEIEAYSKLSLALDVLHECFEPVKEPRTKGDLVKDVVFSKGSEFKRLNFQGFYTALLEKNDELITVATVRVYGEKVAEMPLVGTRFQYRRMGMCRKLLNVLEKKLMELGVQRLTLPAVPAVLNTWTGSFGFSKMTDSERLQLVDNIFLDFQDTVMCQKLLTATPSTQCSLSREVQPILCGNVYRRDSITVLDGSSAVSEIFQADITEDGGFVEELVEYGLSLNSFFEEILIAKTKRR